MSLLNLELFNVDIFLGTSGCPYNYASTLDCTLYTAFKIRHHIHTTTDHLLSNDIDQTGPAKPGGG